VNQESGTFRTALVHLTLQCAPYSTAYIPYHSLPLLVHSRLG